MGQIVTTGATLSCSFGTAPSTLNATSQTKCIVAGKPVATIKDTSQANIAPFGMCTSLANPQVAAATAAALGVLTPQPCMVTAAGTWLSSTKCIVSGIPCLSSDARLICAMGAGNITVVMPGQTKSVVN